MSTPKHSPAPWTFSKIGNPYSHYMIYSEAGAFVCNTVYGEANARLIAAAPELLHACEMAYAELGKMGCECDCENLPTSCPVCACKMAITKAEGNL